MKKLLTMALLLSAISAFAQPRPPVEEQKAATLTFLDQRIKELQGDRDCFQKAKTQEHLEACRKVIEARRVQDQQRRQELIKLRSK